MPDSFQHVLYRNVIIAATAAEVMKTLLVSNCFAMYRITLYTTSSIDALERHRDVICIEVLHKIGLLLVVVVKFR